MTLEKIVIKELSNKAEIINIFNCLSGNITVFTGSETAIDALERTFSGVYEKNDLRISVNDSQRFNPSEHILVGYNTILKDTTLSVENILKNYNFDLNDIDVILNTYGLHNTRELKLYELDEDKKKRLEYAIAFQEDNKALIIKNPFRDLINQWKEPIAKFIHTYANIKKLPVIITELDYESSFWNNNHFIKKYKLGIARTKTIGFGTNNQDLKDFLSQIRNEINNSTVPETNNEDDKNLELKKTQDPIKITKDPINPISNVMPEILSQVPITETNDTVLQQKPEYNKKELKKIHRILFILGALFLFSSFMIIGFLLKVKSDTNQEEVKTRQEILKKDMIQRPKVVKNKNTNNFYILDNYPEWIKQSIELQIKKKDLLTSNASLPLINTSKRATNKQKDNNLFKLLEGLSGSGKDLPDQISNNQGNSGGYTQRTQGNYNNQATQKSNYSNDAEAKRQLLYQRFQEAIRRSREKK